MKLIDMQHRAAAVTTITSRSMDYDFTMFTASSDLVRRTVTIPHYIHYPFYIAEVRRPSTIYGVRSLPIYRLILQLQTFLRQQP